jgi:phosphoglycolate phosphatase
VTDHDTPSDPGHEFDAVVYDLDGTLVHLAVDWDTLRSDVRTLFEATSVPAADADLWTLLDRAGEAGVRDAVEKAVADRELAGARESERLPAADELAGLDIPAAVCSLNCEAACRSALDTHGLADHVDAVVGRDSVAGRKPAPGPLLAALEPLGVAPDRALFVGDSEGDAVAAERAGMAFRWA